MIYQLTIVTKSSLKDEARKKLLDGVISSFGKAKVKETDLGQKPLAYPIRHEVSGNYAIFDIESEENVPADFEKKLFANEDILRHLFLRIK